MDEYNQIQTLLVKHNFRVTKVAAELGIHRTTLWRKMLYYNIDKKNQLKK